MGKIALVKRLVRKHLSRGASPPLPAWVISEIHKQTGETPHVIDLIAEIELEAVRKYTWQPWEVAFLVAHYKELSDQEMAELLHRSEEAVRGKRISMGLRLIRGKKKIRSKGRVV